MGRAGTMAARTWAGAALILMLTGAPSRAAVPATASAPVPPAVRRAVDEAIERVYPALVRIHSVSVYFAEGREVKGQSSGSGVIISADGYVITNHHVAGRSKRLRCTLPDKREIEATLVGSDALADIAVLKLKDGGPYPVAEFGDSDRVRVGDQVLSMGSPRAISQSVTLGIVSNKEMTIPAFYWPQTFRLDGEETGSLVKWIGHDAQIFPGNSGGPLVNLEGEIVGINEISLGLGGAIPGNLARAVADQLIAHGEMRRSWLGLSIQPLLKGSKEERGVLVGGVLADSPADKAGLKAGDLLVAYDDTPIHVRYAEQLPQLNRLMLETPIGAAVELTFVRDGKERKVEAKTEARGPAQGEQAALKSWGLTLQEITLLASKELRRAPQSGVIVSSVRPGAGGTEAKPPLQSDDIIVSVEGRPVRSIKDLVAISDELTKDKSEPLPVLVGFERRTQQMLTVVKIGYRDTLDRSAEATKAWISATTQVLTPDLAKALGVPGKKGVRLTELYSDGAAEKAGLKVGDLILRLDGDEIAASQPEDIELFPSMVRQYSVGASVTLDVVRDTKPMTVEITLAPSPQSSRELAEYRDPHFEFTARDLTFQDRVQQKLAGTVQGALIAGVENGGWAALAQLSVGDIVQSVDGLMVNDAASLQTRMSAIHEKKPTRVVFFVRRGVQTLFVELEPDWAIARPRA
jgi:serine protease Do